MSDADLTVERVDGEIVRYLDMIARATVDLPAIQRTNARIGGDGLATIAREAIEKAANYERLFREAIDAHSDEITKRDTAIRERDEARRIIDEARERIETYTCPVHGEMPLGELECPRC